MTRSQNSNDAPGLKTELILANKFHDFKRTFTWVCFHNQPWRQVGGIAEIAWNLRQGKLELVHLNSGVINFFHLDFLKVNPASSICIDDTPFHPSLPAMKSACDFHMFYSYIYSLTPSVMTGSDWQLRH